MLKTTIGIIGGGNMGEALIKGLHKSYALHVTEADQKRTQYLKKHYRLTIADIDATIQKSHVLILAVKPQDMQTVLSYVKVGNQFSKKDQLVISIAAGLTTRFFEKQLGKSRVVRTMPNMPALIGEGITGICPGKYATPSDLKLAQKLLETIGETVIVKESMIDAVTAVSGSGPAYVFLFVEQWMAAAKKLGFNDNQAKQLVYKTLLGSAHLLEKSEFSAGTLREKVTSKGGTTAAALDVFAKGKFDSLMNSALGAAKKRAKELAK